MLRALAVFVAGMMLLLAIDLGSEPTGHLGQDRAIERALAASDKALRRVTYPEEGPGEGAGDEPAAAAERRERAQSTAFFLEQANLAWRRAEDRAGERGIATEQGSAAMLHFFGKVWPLGWFLLALGAFAARVACPSAHGRHPYWALLYAATSIGIAGGLIALALGVYGLGAPAPVALAPLVSAIVVLNAWLLHKFGRLDRAATLLRLAPILVVLTVGLLVTHELMVRLALLP